MPARNAEKRFSQVKDASAPRYAALMKIVVRWLLLAGALLLVADLYSGVAVASFGAALFAAFLIGSVWVEIVEFAAGKWIHVS